MSRQEMISKWCKKNQIHCHVYEDYLLASIGTFNKKDESMYSVYTPFKNNVYDNENEISQPKNTMVGAITTCVLIRH